MTSATFDKEAGLWTVTSTGGATVKGRVLICADGATSGLATKVREGVLYMRCACCAKRAGWPTVLGLDSC